jgi:serine/threonine-protein phosphatase 5
MTANAAETPGTKNDLPEAVAVLKDNGNKALMAGHPLEAIGIYTEALDLLDEPNAIILSNRAQAFIKVENYGLAISDATLAIEADAAYPKAYYRRGTAHFALSKAKLARKDFKQVCKLRPKDRDARSRYAECDKRVKEALFAAAIQSAETVPLSESFQANDIIIAPNYDGPHPDGGEVCLANGDLDKEDALFEPGKLPMDFVMAAIECFKNQKVIHKRYTARLLIHSKRYFETIPSLVDIKVPQSTEESKEDLHVTVCGDTHGQFYDVMNIFKLNGFPSPTNPYLFNGDFVDRGSFSVEVILTFLMFKMACPESIYLTRGNHETKNMNRIYGFEGEVKAKYDDKIFDLFLEVFGQLPLASVIEDKVFITHGGIPVVPVTLDEIRKIKRGGEPPEKGLMSDLLWSDPQPFPGKSPSKRGVGFAFGPDITEAFLEKNNLELLVRSHEVKDEGYLVEHGNQTITVFSAPNYCDSMGNKGAFIHFGKDCKPKFTQFEAVPHPDVRPMAYAAGMGGLFS